MEVNPLVFETSASTNSAIWASGQLETSNSLVVASFLICVAKVELFSEPANKWQFFFNFFLPKRNTMDYFLSFVGQTNKS